MATKQPVIGGSWCAARTVSAVAAILSCAATQADAEVLTGTLTDVALNEFSFNSDVFGDGTNGVEFIASFGVWDPSLATGSMWFYGSEFSYVDGSLTKCEIAFVPDVLDVSQITDASVFTYTKESTDTRVAVTGAPLPFGSAFGLVLMRNEITGHYGALRLDGMRVENPGSFTADGIDVTWWFQTDGTGDFSSVPAPATMPVLFLAPAMLGRRRRRH